MCVCAYLLLVLLEAVTLDFELEDGVVPGFDGGSVLLGDWLLLLFLLFGACRL